MNRKLDCKKEPLVTLLRIILVIQLFCVVSAYVSIAFPYSRNSISACFTVIALLAMLLVSFCLFKQIRNIDRHPKFHQLLPFFILIIVSILGYQLVTSPISSWDALGTWTREALLYKSQQFIHPFSNYSQPQTIAFFLSATSSGVFKVLLLLPLVGLMCCAFVICSGSYLAPAAFCFLACTPLIENHVLLYGYPEIWVAYQSTLSLLLLTLAKRGQGPGALILAACGLGCLILTRDTGLLDAALVLSVASLYAAAKKLTTRTSKSTFLIIVSIAFYLLVNHPSTGLKVQAFGHSLGLDLNSPAMVPEIFAHALFYNSSYSIVFLCWIGAFSLAIYRWVLFNEELSVWILATCVYLVFHMLVIIWFEYFLSHSMVGGDTWLSRKLIPAAVFAIFTILTTVKRNFNTTSFELAVPVKGRT